MSIGVCLAALALLNLSGSGTGRILSWIFQAVIFVLGCVIMPGEVFTTRYIKAAFHKSDDPSLRGWTSKHSSMPLRGRTLPGSGA
ncbi:hypothetical protein OIE67_29985 [Nonomuraea fuscirosea]|uniref:hypothetical protein n=1 Tax=Nonomuraea fuscirosea TaxID=1291556 RepID=UPI002DD928FF|nr:hypothetical protein [Nonomuraea fuscirosea]WSA48308.1 hypothetical protein OIE67_29985 [Nonomuraea fuscirosea]